MKLKTLNQYKKWTQPKLVILTILNHILIEILKSYKPCEIKTSEAISSQNQE